MKKYKITYPVVAFVFTALAVFYFGFFFKAGIVPTIWMSVGSACAGLILARIVLHLIDKDNEIRTWQVTIYGLFGVAGWILAAISQGATYSTLFTMIAVSFATLYLGSYLPDRNEDGIPDCLQDPKKVFTKDYLKAKALYKFKKDILGAKVEKDRPLCLCNGKPYTVVQAIAEGFVAEAEEATKYIDSLFVD